ncbi:MAG: hypothetical protein WKF50_09615, partial [Nocardioides sp.]
ELPRTGVFSDGSLVSVWEHDDTGADDDLTRIFRSTRAPGEDWSAPEAFPVDDVWGLGSISTLPDGGIQIAYGWEPHFPDIVHRVRIWGADGSVTANGLGNTSDDYVLYGDADGHTIAERLGGYHEEAGFDHVLRYHDGVSWQRVPALGADPRDVFVAGPGESVWMAGYDQERTMLRVRRWAPGQSSWTLDWSRDYPPGHQRRPLVDGLDLAVGGPGHVVLAFQEREVGDTGATIRAVRHDPDAGWRPVRRLQRLAVGEHLTTTAPVVSAAGANVEVAWTSSAPQRGGARQVWLAQLGDGASAPRLLATVESFSGFRSLSLDVDVRDDGDVLVTYLERDGDMRNLVGLLGPSDQLERTVLLEDTGVALGEAAFLVRGVAAVVGAVRGELLLSRVAEGAI